MRFKVFIVSVFFVCSMLPGISLAQNKVVVIPLDSGKCDEIPTVTSANGRVWMDRNLGANRVAQSVDDYRAYGWLYQWGRLADGHEIRSSTTPTASTGDVPGHGDFITSDSSPYDWRSLQNDNLWQGVAGVNNPCPAGFRVPTGTEWDTERASWGSNDPAGAFASPLKLVLAGFRTRSSGAIFDAGSYGYYWSSTVIGNQALILNIYRGYAGVDPYHRAYGHSVRCIKD